MMRYLNFITLTPRWFEFHQFDIQSTGQKSHWISNWHQCNAMSHALPWQYFPLSSSKKGLTLNQKPEASVFSQSLTGVKLNKVCFPRWLSKARSLGSGFVRKDLAISEIVLENVGRTLIKLSSCFIDNENERSCVMCNVCRDRKLSLQSALLQRSCQEMLYTFRSNDERALKHHNPMWASSLIATIGYYTIRYNTIQYDTSARIL